jgi:hypothetical protein
MREHPAGSSSYLSLRTASQISLLELRKGADLSENSGRTSQPSEERASTDLNALRFPESVADLNLERDRDRLYLPDSTSSRTAHDTLPEHVIREKLLILSTWHPFPLIINPRYKLTDIAIIASSEYDRLNGPYAESKTKS